MSRGSMRPLLFLLAMSLLLPLALPAVAADEAEPQSEPSSDPSAPEKDQSCMVARSNVSPSRPVEAWIIPDPDGCYRRLVDRVLPPWVGIVVNEIRARLP